MENNGMPSKGSRIRVPHNRGSARMKGVFMALITLCLAGCEAGRAGVPQKAAGILRIATWNVQTLFDGTDTGTEYDDYRHAAGWTDEKYRARLLSLSLAVERLDEGVPDMLGLIEVENSHILTDLVQGPLAKYAYNWTFFGANPGSSLGIGIISRFPLEQTLIHSITAHGETIPRPVLEVRLQVENQPLVCFVCHWKSKLGGEEITESLRRSAARIIVRRIQEISQENPAIPVIVMGDLNENHDEFYRKGGMVISALLPDDPRAAELSGFTPDSPGRDRPRDFLILSRQKPPKAEYFGPESAALYSPWGQELEEGSYNYKQTWETIDHFLLSQGLFDQRGWNFASCMRINQEPFINTQGYPDRYNPRTGNGLSDHLPLVLTLKYIPGASD